MQCGCRARALLAINASEGHACRLLQDRSMPQRHRSQTFRQLLLHMAGSLNSLLTVWQGCAPAYICLLLLAGSCTLQWYCRSHTMATMTLALYHACRCASTMHDVGRWLQMHPVEVAYPLRPEVLESCAALFAAKPSPHFQRIGAAILDTLYTSNHCTCGYCTVANISSGARKLRVPCCLCAACPASCLQAIHDNVPHDMQNSCEFYI